jgi:hypothetical protein
MTAPERFVDHKIPLAPRAPSIHDPTAAVEFEPIKNYLVIEAGLTPFFDNGGHADWDFDLLFRHPLELSKKAEFEPGIGADME